MKYKLIILIVLLPILLAAIDEDAGTTGFSFFKVNYSARAAAMASAYTGLSNDANAVFFNPAGLVQVQNTQAGVMHTWQFSNLINYDYIGFTTPLSPNKNCASPPAP